MQAEGIYAAIRNVFATSTAEPAAHAGHVSVQGLAVARTAISSVLPSRIWADMFIGLVLLGIGIYLAYSIFNNCRALGCAFIKLGFLCFFFIVVAFWTLSLLQMSNDELGGPYGDRIEWLLSALKNGGASKL